MGQVNSAIYRKLAVTNIKKNYKTYIPYILTSILTVMMYFIMHSLTINDSMGDGSVSEVLKYATFVIIVFSVIFLFYTNSFLIKRRKKEIGVYNILGMSKGHLARMLIVESLIISGISIAAGLMMSILFGKLTWWLLLKLIRYDIRMDFQIPGEAVSGTIILFAIIFALTLVYNLIQMHRSKPVELLRGGKEGEKEPKTKVVMTVFGAAMLGIGYYIALTTKSPLEALFKFFTTVLAVVLGTYALFVAGSIAVLKALRKNKKFYYKSRHFTAVSGMLYRMKQNAVGLSNICILSTMVLVLVSTAVSMYIGTENMLKSRFPWEIEVIQRPFDERGSRILREL